jgi:predicted RNA binding protein YcfA (HicA-like mRNA interferase family)
MKYSELEKKLKKYGCYKVKNGANHPLWFSPITKKIFPTSYHGSQEVKLRTLNSIIEQSGIKL